MKRSSPAGRCDSRTRRGFGLLLGGFLSAGLTGPAAVAQPEAGPAESSPLLKICADPYMLPFSNKDEQGYENRIAELFAKQLGREVRYEWFPQRMGFIRQTLRSRAGDGEYKCDLVISVPEQFELAETTEPYYTSTYVLVFARGRNLDDVSTPEQFRQAVGQGRRVRIGLTDQGPAQLWVFRSGLMDHMVPYQGQPADPKVNPGEVLMEDIASGKIDAAIVWGPTAGYYAKEMKDRVEIVQLPLHDDRRFPDMKFEYSIAMAVRYGDDKWKNTVDELIRTNHQEINDILRDFGVPLLPLKKSPEREDDDD